MFDSPHRIRKKVQRLRKKGKMAQAIELQRQLCQADEDSAEDWQVLAELASESELPDLELASRVQAARASRAGPDVWLELASKAKEAGFKSDAVDATFRAADAAARLGDCRHAIELCDSVLAMAADHRAAKRIRSIMERRMASQRGDEEDTWRNWPPEGSRGGSTDDAEQGGDEPGLVAAPADILEPPPVEVRSTKRIQVTPELHRARSAAIQKTPVLAIDGHEVPPGSAAPAAGPTLFIFEPQTWPSVLDRNCLMFVGGIDRIAPEVQELAEPTDLPAQSVIYEQGKTGQLLYCLDEGEVRAVRQRGAVQDFGAISAGSFFGEVSTITGFASTATVTTQCPCKLRVFTRERFQKLHREGAKPAGQLLSFLRTWYMEVAANLSPLLSHCSPEELGLLADSANWMTFQASERLAEEGQEGDLYTVIAGLASVTRAGVDAEEALGYLTTGDLVGAVSPSPVTVEAASLVFALKVDRERVSKLSKVALKKLEEHVEEVNGVLTWLDGER